MTVVSFVSSEPEPQFFYHVPAPSEPLIHPTTYGVIHPVFPSAYDFPLLPYYASPCVNNFGYRVPCHQPLGFLPIAVSANDVDEPTIAVADTKEAVDLPAYSEGSGSDQDDAE